MTTYGIEQLTEMRGANVYSADGDKIGSVEDVYVDEQTGQPEWLGLGQGLFGKKRILVPVQGAEPADDGLRVPYSKEQVNETPGFDAEQISQDEEARLYAHYGLEYSHAPSETGLPEGRVGTGSEEEAFDRDVPEAPVPAGETGEGQAVTRSEEELHVGKRETEVGRLRVHKWTETEQVDVPVEVRREKARVTREPVEGTVPDQEMGDDALEVTLSEEQPVIEKQAVAKERIGIEKDVETDTETVSEELRKERVDVDDDDLRR